MADLQKIDQHTEFKMTNTILKAASRAMASTLDPSIILALLLKKADIPKELSKVAAHAFNRRLSVTKLATSTDLTKALDFNLADADKVALLTGSTKLKKLASVINAPFLFSILNKAAMSKVASTSTPKTENPITVLKMLVKLLKLLDLGLIYISDLNYSINKDTLSLRALTKKASLKLINDKKLSKQLTTQYGTAYTSLFQLLPKLYLEKYAAYTVLGKNLTTLLVDKAIQLDDKIKYKKLLYKLASIALNLLCVNAISIDKQIQKQRLLGILKLANVVDYSKQLVADGVLNPTIFAANMLSEGVTSFADYTKRMHDLTSKNLASRPDSVITSLLIAEDKMHDLSAALTNVLADPDTKLYPTRLILRAVYSAVALNPSYLSPRYSEFLKADVKLRLIAGGKTNAARQAATSSMLKDIAEADKAKAAESVLSKVKSLGLKTNKNINAPKLIPSLKLLGDFKYIRGDKNIYDLTFNYIKLLGEAAKENFKLLLQLSAGVNVVQSLVTMQLDSARKALIQLKMRQIAANQKKGGNLGKVNSPKAMKQIKDQATKAVDNLLAKGYNATLLLTAISGNANNKKRNP